MGAPTNGFVNRRENTPYRAAHSCAIGARLSPQRCLAEWQARVKRLPPQQRLVVEFIANGYANKNIADAMGIGIKTVEKHRQWAYLTLNVHSAALLTRVAVLCGIVPPYLQPTAQPKPKNHNRKESSSNA